MKPVRFDSFDALKGFLTLADPNSQYRVYCHVCGRDHPFVPSRYGIFPNSTEVARCSKSLLERVVYKIAHTYYGVVCPAYMIGYNIRSLAMSFAAAGLDQNGLERLTSLLQSVSGLAGEQCLVKIDLGGDVRFISRAEICKPDCDNLGNCVDLYDVMLKPYTAALVPRNIVDDAIFRLYSVEVAAEVLARFESLFDRLVSAFCEGDYASLILRSGTLVNGTVYNKVFDVIGQVLGSKTWSVSSPYLGGLGNDSLLARSDNVSVRFLSSSGPVIYISLLEDSMWMCALMPLRYNHPRRTILCKLFRDYFYQIVEKAKLLSPKTSPRAMSANPRQQLTLVSC